MKVLLLAAALSVSTTAFADSCRDIDVRDRMTPEMQEVFKTPFQQGKVGWCYAYATADLLSARLNQHFSPFHIGLSFSTNISGFGALGRNLFGLKNKGGFFDGGFTRDAFNHMKKRGQGCSENAVNSQLDQYGVIRTHLQYVEDIYNNKSSNEYGLMYAELNAKDFFESRFPPIDPVKAIQYVKSRQARSVPHAVMNIAEAACQGHQITIPKSLRLASHVKEPNVKMAPFIDRALNAYKPVSFRYNLKNLVATSEGFWMDNFSQHVSTIVGRKKVGNQCMYVVRNSWGQTCDGYKQGIFCNQQEGTFQIPIKELEKAAYAVDYIVN